MAALSHVVHRQFRERLGYKQQILDYHNHRFGTRTRPASEITPAIDCWPATPGRTTHLTFLHEDGQTCTHEWF